MAEQFLCPYLQPLPAAVAGAIHSFVGAKRQQKQK